MNKLLKKSKPKNWFKIGKIIKVNDLMQKNYSYKLTARYGKDFDKEFKPEISPDKMLKNGVFEGKYLNDCILEFPKEWFIKALKKNKLSPEYADESKNEFKVKSRLSLQEWRKRKWIPITKGDKDVRGWFQWFCRYWIGRRDENVDAIQIKRWKAFVRHKAQIVKDKRNPKLKTNKKNHRARQRQALLQWSYNPYV